MPRCRPRASALLLTLLVSVERMREATGPHGDRSPVVMASDLGTSDLGIVSGAIEKQTLHGIDVRRQRDRTRAPGPIPSDKTQL